MKIKNGFFVVLFILLLTGLEVQAQYGYGNGYGYGRYGGGYGYGNRGSSIPQVETPQKEPEPLTADEIVDNEMPDIALALELNEFETAVLSSILKKYVQQRIEMRILKLEPDQMREQMEKITKEQTEELKAGLPLEKYEAFVALQKKGVSKTIKEKKRKKKKKNKSTQDDTN
ncbi:hypothetical protein [Maribacter polysaccharolyticus]|uniref:hypothetical protein n=1 Tax=Maribacter polysaccharolyticus TaxID=3020831 RepID=UPI00237F9B1E|nr:hypothetical protein [Maribacter polysaccharolyticus]MDE3743376.1 hypothetical protein [Maribacter polysaccharolyticus]